MARKRSKSKKNRKGFIAIPFTAQLALSTLASLTVLDAAVLSATWGEDIFIISVDSYWSLRDLTPGEGPIIVGFAHGDLSVGEIAENLNAEVTDPDDIIARERARRPVRKAGQFTGLLANEALNDGKKLRTRLKFSVGEGHNLAFWARNDSGATLTTGAILNLSGTLYGRWQR